VTTLTMVPNVNTSVSGGTVGCYHIRLGAYGDFSAAKHAASQYAGGFPAYVSGKYYAMIGNYQSVSAANSARVSLGVAGEIFTGSNRCVAVTKTGTTQILFEFDAGTSANLAVRPVNNFGRAVTWFKNYAYYGDFEYYRHVSDRLTVINVIDIESYVKGILPYEMSSSWPAEALKAQAVCARSYTIASLGGYQSYGFDLTADTYSQVYYGTNLANANTDAAVDATSGEYVTHNGKVCSAFYFSSDGGATENSENIFLTALPYLRGVTDPYEEDVPQSLNGYKSWTRTFSGAALRSKLSSSGYKGGNVVSISPAYSENGNVIALTLADASGVSVTLTKSACYSVIGLPSVRYSVNAFADSSGSFAFEGSGFGHSVGMSQFGAYSMARFHGLNYRQILRFYYTGVSISKSV
jgi:stage II sporulation protein D